MKWLNHPGKGACYCVIKQKLVFELRSNRGGYNISAWLCVRRQTSITKHLVRWRVVNQERRDGNKTIARKEAKNLIERWEAPFVALSQFILKIYHEDW